MYSIKKLLINTEIALIRNQMNKIKKLTMLILPCMGYELQYMDYLIQSG